MLKPLILDNKRLRNHLDHIPSQPGCYLMHDKQGNVLYIGKSKNLINRVKTYFRDSNDHNPRILLMIRQIYDIEIIVTDNESEALTLESNLIKANQPYFNILLKDDKKYPYICITWSEKYPRIFITRKRLYKNTIDKYYGPFVDVNLLRNTLFLIKSIFPLRQRSRPLYKDRTCLNFDIKRCPGVCQEIIDPEKYKSILKKVEMIFQGRTNELNSKLVTKMQIYSQRLEYEKALFIRDQIKGLEKIGENQKVILPNSSISRDILAIEIDNQICSTQIFQMRSGKLVGRLGYISKIMNDKPNSILQRILEEHYSKVDNIEIPSEVITQYLLPQESLIRDWLTSLRKKQVKVYSPIKGKKHKLVQLVRKNAKYEIERLRQGQKINMEGQEDLAQILELSNLPRRIEGYDISHISGSDAVGSQVVFIDGIPAKNQYRKYKIRSNKVVIGHSDDYLSISEVLRRRFRRWSNFKREGGNFNDLRNLKTSVLDSVSINDWPDLVMIDGGRGQLNSAINVFKEMELFDHINLCSLAKNKEEIFVPNHKDSLDTQMNDPGLILLRKVRDEAHRFAITYHKNLRSKRMTKSELENIQGLGSKRIKELITYFNSVEAIKLANVEEICKVNGVGRKMAELISDHFNK